MFLTKALEHQLRHYLSSDYYNDYAEERDPTEQVRKNVDRLLEELNLEYGSFSRIECGLSDACAAYERQFFQKIQSPLFEDDESVGVTKFRI